MITCAKAMTRGRGGNGRDFKLQVAKFSSNLARQLFLPCMVAYQAIQCLSKRTDSESSDYCMKRWRLMVRLISASGLVFTASATMTRSLKAPLVLVDLSL